MRTCGRRRAAPPPSTEARPTAPLPPGRGGRLAVAALFVGLLVAFALGLWGTLLRPAAYEIRGTIVARPAPDVVLVRHEAHPGLGMHAMEQMAVSSDPARLDAAGVKPGDHVRLAVRREGDRVLLLRLEKLR